ncbi:serine hydrolase [Asticcacaulis sp. ZE23SCel15]|uniref:serine hydrolase domain-containing protein n=1 Tax=Asticcacaulis sp. ZE23SCel15 TaxID=3059027 RepID=UPI00265F0D7A|nr:serine hydrolase [Asticcacaulis sp. ZE23SCel15]WKL57337.1 serine hydrolase [Asticcacaulis sp. ZE23SCel15]
MSQPKLNPTSSEPPLDTGWMVDLYAGQMMPDDQVQALQTSERAFATRVIKRGGAVRGFKAAARQIEDFPIRSNDQDYDLYDYVSRNRVAGLLITHNDAIVHERYELSFEADQRWLSMSMAKSVATTLIGVAIQDGYIASVEELLTKYLPELIGSAYDGVSIRQLIQMTSGVKWDDTHTNPASERRHMLDLQLSQDHGAIMAYMASLPRVAEPGTVWNYSTGETHVVGALVKAATGKWLADYLSEKIWSKLGMESDALWWLEAPGGLEVAGSGICATLRDYVRFARFVLEDGVIGGERVLPEGWVKAAGAARDVGGQLTHYGYMWWSVPDAAGSFEDGAFSARGIFGQFLYINPKKNILIAVLSSRSKPRLSEVIVDNDFFNAAVTAITKGY